MWFGGGILSACSAEKLTFLKQLVAVLYQTQQLQVCRRVIVKPFL